MVNAQIIFEQNTHILILCCASESHSGLSAEEGLRKGDPRTNHAHCRSLPPAAAAPHPSQHGSGLGSLQSHFWISPPVHITQLLLGKSVDNRLCLVCLLLVAGAQERVGWFQGVYSLPCLYFLRGLSFQLMPLCMMGKKMALKSHGPGFEF